MKILIAEDNRQDRAILRFYLEEKGWDVLEAADGRAGLDLAVAEKPDVIVSDVLMREMDGYELLREVRRHDGLKNIPFIFYSGIYFTPEEAKLAHELGVNAFIAKPQQPDAFCRHIENTINEVSAKPEAADPDLLTRDEVFLRRYNDVISNQLKRKIKTLEEANLAIEKQQTNYRDLFNSIRDVIIVADLDRRVIDANQPALRDIFGYELEDILGRSTAILYPDEESFRKMGETFFDDITMTIWSSVISEFRRKNGELFKCEFYPLKITDTDGNVVANVAMIRDISKRQKIEDVLHNVFESMGEGLAIIDRDLNIIEANKAFLEMFNGESGSAVGRKCFQVTRGIDSPCYLAGEECPAEKVFKTGEPQSTIRHQQDSSGKPIYFLNRCDPIKDRQGRVTSVIEIYRDITEQTLLEEQLRQAQKMEAIGTLTGGIAHDFNNILSVIVGHGTLMQMKMDADHPMKKSVLNIMQAAERASSLTQRLLAFSRKQHLSMEPVILCDVVAELENFLQKMITEEIHLELNLDDDPFVVEADRSQLEQVIMNLVINAAQAISGGGEIEINVEHGEIGQSFVDQKGFGEPGTYAVLSVRDNGCGMDEETRLRIYEPFFTTKEVGQGTGLGLSMAYGIIKQHEGFIDCSSTPGEGTTFRIYLPLTDQSVCSYPQNHVPTGDAGGRETILVAEDDANVRQLLCELLEDAGYRVETAANGLEAVRLFTEFGSRIDLFILDVIMPGMNGQEVLDEIRRHDEQIKALFISGYTDDIIVSKGVIKSEEPFLQKPVHPNELLKTIRSILD